MKYYGKIDDPKDLVTKEYVDDLYSPPFVISDVPPNDKNKLWIYQGSVYYYDKTGSCWKKSLSLMDKSEIPDSSGDGFTYSDNCPFIISTNPPSNKSKLWIKNGVVYYYNYSEQAWINVLFSMDINSIQA